MKIVYLIIAYALISNQAFSTEKASAKDGKPNIVFIFADDQAPDTIAAYGNKEILTPNLDQLAQQGVNFTNAHNMGSWAGAVCIASRTMLNTGRSLWRAQDIYNQKDNRLIEPQMWSNLLSQQGYETYMTGKWHVHIDADKIFDNVKHVRPGMPKDTWDHWAMVEKFANFYNGESEFNYYEDFMPNGYNRPKSPQDNSWSPTDPKHGGFYEGGKHWSDVVKDNAIEFIADIKKKGKPFFMYIAFNAPHDPRQAPQEYQNLYTLDALTVPENFQAEYPEKDLIGNGPQLRDAALAPFPRTKYATVIHKKEYYALISHLDTQVGDIITALKASGEYDNTYIIYTADHGLAVGEHGLFGKQNMYEHSIRSPFIIWGPGLEAGRMINSDIYIQDAMATSLALAGMPKSKDIFFNSIIELAKGRQKESHYPAIYGAYKDSQRMIKKDGYKLILYPFAQKIKLFNLNNDPNEITNLADIKEYKSTINSLLKELQKLQAELDDPLDLSTFTFN